MTTGEPVVRAPGVYAVPFPPNPAAPAPEGRWAVVASAVDEIGQSSTMTRSFRVDTTLGRLRVAARLYVPPRGRDWPITWTLTRGARVKVTVETTAGAVVRTLALRRYEAGSPVVYWNGLGRDRKRVRGGPYVVRVVATSTLGRVELTRVVRVQQVVGPRPARR